MSNPTAGRITPSLKTKKVRGKGIGKMMNNILPKNEVKKRIAKTARPVKNVTLLGLLPISVPHPRTSIIREKI